MSRRTARFAPMREWLVVAVLVALAGIAATPATARAQTLDAENIYAEDVQRAERALARARDRLATATTEIVDAQRRLPGAEKRAARLRAAVDRRKAPATRAAKRADRAEAAVREARRRAHRAVAASHAEQARALTRWRDERARWVALTAMAFAIAAAMIATVSVAVVRSNDSARKDKLANVIGLSMATGVAAYLCALLGGMLAADTWLFSWWLVAAAATGVVAPVAGVVVAWNRPTPIARARVRLGRTAIPIAIAAVALTTAPGATAASLTAPQPQQLDAETRRLATQHRADAPMPREVQRLRTRANRLLLRETRMRSRAGDARDRANAIFTAQLRAQEAADRARRSITHWEDQLHKAQRDYDDYQALIEEPDDEEPEDEDPIPDFDYTPPDFDDDYGYTPGTGATTEDFGSGRGRIGLCRDGTLSDSIGRPGACSHHGGVAGG